MRIAKETGGCSLTWQRKTYTWKADGAVVDVPAAFGEELLSIRGAGFSEAGPEPVTEPAPKADVTEPAPKAKAAVTEARPAK